MTTTVQDRAFLEDYTRRLTNVLEPTADLVERIVAARDLMLACKKRGGTVIIVGNGGSAGIASHLAIDLAKNARVPAACYNDGGQITCLANDYGFENWIAHALRLNARAGDLLVAISSSGRSPNILNAVHQARQMELGVITLSGMQPDNPLRGQGDVDFWVDSRSYNIVETAHQFWIMSVIDLIIGHAEYPAN